MKRTLLVIAILASIATMAKAQLSEFWVLEFIAPDGQTLSIDLNEIIQVQVRPDQEFDQVWFQLDDAMTAAMADFTTENVDQRITIMVCGEVVFEPLLLTPMHGGAMVLGGFSEGKAVDIGNRLSGRRSC